MALVLGFLVACSADPNEATGPDAPDPGSPSVSQPEDALVRSAEALVRRIGALESAADVTCWTSFRQLDAFVASKPLHPVATQAKTEQMKRLTRALWAKASGMSSAPILGQADLHRTLDPSKVTLADAERQMAEYRTTSEHWRVLLAVAFDGIRNRTSDLKPLDVPTEDSMGLLVSRLSLTLLHEANTVAELARSRTIEPAHVVQAADVVSDRFGLEPGGSDDSAPNETSPAALAFLTRGLIDAKIEALRKYNKASVDLHRELNRIDGLPVSAGVADALRRELVEFVRFVANGRTPWQPSEALATDYIDVDHVELAVEGLFPHRVLENGDVMLTFASDEGPPVDVMLLDHRMNAVRDTALQWVVVAEAWQTRNFAMDPFAAESLSEAVSIIATHVLGESRRRAVEAGATEVALEHLVTLRDAIHRPIVAESAEDSNDWGAQEEAAKRRVLARYGRALFADVTEASRFPTARRTAAVTGAFDVQTAMGEGVAVGDVNADGYPDLYFPGAGLGRLLINRGRAAPGEFDDKTRAWGVPPTDSGHHALFVDFDGDDDLDLVVVQSRGPSLLLEQRDGRFHDVAAEVGFRTARGAHTASIFDFDNDGDLDIYVGYYGNAACDVDCPEGNLPSLDGRNGRANELWRNDGGRFTEIGPSARVADKGWTLATGTFDYDADGDLDLYLANDFGANVLLRNRGNGAFEDVAIPTRSSDRGSGMNVSFIDVDNDGWWDVYVSNIDMFSKTIKNVFPSDASLVRLNDSILRSMRHLSGNRLYVNQAAGDGRAFGDQEALFFEPGDRGWAWASVFFDYDNDGDEDMYLANGWIPGAPGGDQRNQMFLFDGGHFYLGPEGSPEAFAGNSRSAVAVDVDLDGDLDLVVTHYRQPPRLFRNEQRSGHHALRLRLRGHLANSSAIGAEVIVRTQSTVSRRQVTCGLGYLGQDSGVVHVGLGPERAAAVEIRWPGGAITRYPALQAGRVHELRAPMDPSPRLTQSK